MGLTESKPERLTTEERTSREVSKQTIAQQRKQEITNLQQSIVSERALVNPADIVRMVKVTETAKTQLDRVGNALTKSDLVAIVIALDSTMRNRLEELESMRVTDLNSLIRSIIYDPKRLFQSTSQPAASSSVSSVEPSSIGYLGNRPSRPPQLFLE
jgi:hypothetical protein